MSGFSEEQMTRPLFEEPTVEQERIDPSDGPPGFLIGGMANSTFQHMGQQYFDAANLLVETIRMGEWEDYRLANPVLYLYRHSIELFLKSVLGGAGKTHNLSSLADDFQAFIKAEFGADLPDWISNRLNELAALDPGSTAFRYSQNYDKASKIDLPVDGEYYVDLFHLQSAMMALNSALVGVVAAKACGEGKSAPAHDSGGGAAG
ncbi:MAG: hypothetical protein HN403_04265 [Rhodospirillales bacterium]|jgi:hypothetical protein|nr:hypothetical protein [Rhodospirillales bacterium]